MKVDISIIIVNYNTKYLLYNCIDSIVQNISINFEIIIVDNASKDDSIKECSSFRNDPRIKFILLDENLGFSKGNNKGADSASGDIFHFLNPDTTVNKDLNQDYLHCLANQDNVYINQLINPDGSLENTKKAIPSLKNIFLWKFNKAKAKYWCIGASIIISKHNYLKIGKWSEDYFLYSEDLDLFYQLWQNNINIEFLDAMIFHFKGGSSCNIWSNLEREIIVQKSMKIFFAKHFSQKEYIAVKVYYILHDLVKRPSKTIFNIKAWLGASRK